MSRESDDKQYFFEMFNDVDKKVSVLPSDGYIRAVLNKEHLQEISEWIKSNNSNDLEWANWPPLFLYIMRNSEEEILSFENDIELVVKNSKQMEKVTHFLSAKVDEARLWCGGLFELFVKSQFIKNGLQIELDYILPNGKENDLKISIGDKTYYLECTVLTDSDEDIKVWDKFMEAKKVDRSATLVRPGKYDEPNAKTPSLYYDCLRFYTKVYDKVAPMLNVEESQLLNNTKNVLLVSICASHSILTHSPGVGWALDELLADQPRGGFSPQGITDVSLSAWIEFTAKELMNSKKLDFAKYDENFDKIISAPRRIGAILLFNKCSLKEARVNYNAHKECKISHKEIAQIETGFDLLPSWCSD